MATLQDVEAHFQKSVPEALVEIEEGRVLVMATIPPTHFQRKVGEAEKELGCLLTERWLDRHFYSVSIRGC